MDTRVSSTFQPSSDRIKFLLLSHLFCHCFGIILKHLFTSVQWQIFTSLLHRGSVNSDSSVNTREKAKDRGVYNNYVKRSTEYKSFNYISPVYVRHNFFLKNMHTSKNTGFQEYFSFKTCLTYTATLGLSLNNQPKLQIC